MASDISPAYTSVTEDSMRDALIEARGDIFVASQLLGITAIRFDRAIQVSAKLQAAVAEIREEHRDPKNSKGLADEEIRHAIDRRLHLYRVAGLDALHDLATMPLDDNSAQNQVKLAAAARLAGSTEGAGGGGEIGEALRSLNDSYQQHAPRLRVIRERMTVEISQDERLVGEGQAQSKPE